MSSIRFHHAPTRSHEMPKRLLADFHCYLQTDGYSA
ncbi:IS66 family transposase [Thiohalorhabdus sp. Cl-TMA]|uniref:Transposase n=1 Tax=Thiohalorhabdus methylotrophus TaxID=3242694 RepID=A0ABV4TVB9_9GAMM